MQEVQGGRVTGSLFSVIPGESPHRLLERRGLAPFFLYPTPDGSRVAYLASEAGQAGLYMGSITVDGEDDLTHGRGQPFYAAWSPDSSTLLTHVGLPIGPAGSVMQFQSLQDLIGGVTGAPPLALATGRFQAPAFSPDGQSFAIAFRGEDTSTVAIVASDAHEIDHLVPLAGTAAFAWSPDGRRLAFLDGENARIGGIVGQLSVTSLADREVHLVSEQATAFFRSPDGSKILFFEPRIVGDGGRSSLLYRVGVYRIFDGESKFIATIRPAPAFVQQIVPFFDQYHRAYTIWSPDSRLVVLNASDSRGVPVIHLVDTERLRSGERFTVDYALPVQSGPIGGLIAEDGIDSRVIAPGTVPFFSSTVDFFVPAESPGFGF